MPLSDLIKQLDKKKMPRHIAIIMDGNGRWAKKRNLPRVAGHREGVKTVDKIVTQCRSLGINALTLYAFSEENWNRPKMEINALMFILKKYLRKELPRMQKENIRFNTIGKIKDMPVNVRNLINETKQKTEDNDGMIFTLALSYGSRGEIIEVVKKIARDAVCKKISISQIDHSVFEAYLFTSNLPEPDLLIRTSGELRISNFLLWQIAYTELYFTDLLWPDFKKEDLLQAIISFQKRDRRYGLVQE